MPAKGNFPTEVLFERKAWAAEQLQPIIWLQLNVSGFRSVLARGWHGRGERPLLFGLGQYFVNAGLIFRQAATPGRVGPPLAMGLRIALDPFSPPGQQSLIFGVRVPRRLPDTPDEVLKLISRDSHPDPSLRGGLHLAMVPDQTHPMNELAEPGVLARAVLPQASRTTATDGDLHFDKSLAGLIDGANPGDRAGIVADGARRVDHAIHSAWSWSVRRPATARYQWLPPCSGIWLARDLFRGGRC